MTPPSRYSPICVPARPADLAGDLEEAWELADPCGEDSMTRDILPMPVSGPEPGKG
jgi:hypothetical protein